MAINISIYLANVAFPKMVCINVKKLINLCKIKLMYRYACIYYKNI